MKTKITQAEFDALSADDKAKYTVVDAEAEDKEYTLTAPADEPPADAPETPKLTKAQKAAAAAAQTEAINAAVATAKAEWLAEQKRKEDEENGEFESLYTDLKAKFDTQTEELTKLREVVDAEIEARAAALPDDVKPLYELAGESREAKLLFLQKASTLKKKLGDPPSTPPKPGTKEFEAEMGEIAERRMSSGIYS